MIPIRPLQIALLCVTASNAHTQEKEVINSLESEFAQSVFALHKPVTERYVTALEALKKTYESRGELPSAAAVSRELERARKHLEPSLPLFPSRLSQPKTTGLFTFDDTSRPDPDADPESDLIPRTARGDLSLKPADATFTGGANLLVPQEIAQGFVKTGASATWSVPDIPPGVYDVIIDYSAGAKGGGGNLRVTALSAETDVEIVPLGTWKNFRRKQIGGIKVTTPPVTLKITVNSSKGPAGVLAIRQVILRPRRS